MWRGDCAVSRRGEALRLGGGVFVLGCVAVGSPLAEAYGTGGTMAGAEEGEHGLLLSLQDLLEWDSALWLRLLARDTQRSPPP